MPSPPNFTQATPQPANCRWSYSNAFENPRVACRQLGYPYGEMMRAAHNNWPNPPPSGYTLRPGSFPINMVFVDCVGSESALTLCSYRTDTGACRHFEDVYLVCSSTARE